MIEFRNAITFFVVFLTIPYGMVGALIALLLMGQPSALWPSWGIISLGWGDASATRPSCSSISLKRSTPKGSPLEEALLDAGIIRLRPVMITVGATVSGHGRGLRALGSQCATPRSAAWRWPLLSHPAPGTGLFSIFVLDLKIVTWEVGASEA